MWFAIATSLPYAYEYKSSICIFEQVDEVYVLRKKTKMTATRRSRQTPGINIVNSYANETRFALF